MEELGAEYPGQSVLHLTLLYITDIYSSDSCVSVVSHRNGICNTEKPTITILKLSETCCQQW